MKIWLLKTSNSSKYLSIFCLGILHPYATGFLLAQIIIIIKSGQLLSNHHCLKYILSLARYFFIFSEMRDLKRSPQLFKGFSCFSGSTNCRLWEFHRNFPQLELMIHVIIILIILFSHIYLGFPRAASWGRRSF